MHRFSALSAGEWWEIAGRLFVTGDQLGDGVEKHSSVGDEGKEEAQHGAEDGGRYFAVFDVHPDEDEAFDGEDGGGEDG